MDVFCFFLAVLFACTTQPALIALFGALLYIKPSYSQILSFCCGLLITVLHLNLIAPQGMPDAKVIPQAEITGTIASIPVAKEHKTQFLFQIDSINQQPASSLVQLAWYQKPPQLHVGERWHLQVKLKKPRNYYNPGSFDFEQAMATRHISWTGYIRNKGNYRINDTTKTFAFQRFREYIQQRLITLAPNRATAGILEALTLNTSSQITQDEWELFRNTGTTHLFGISGEHIALVSGLFFYVFRALWTRLTPWAVTIPASYAGGIAGLIAASFYAFLAGFAPPVQRALIGCFLYTLFHLGRQKFSAWQIWRYALIFVLCVEPHAVFMQGFYFSFLAVACLLLTQQRWNFQKIKGKLALQLACLVGLLPLSLYWYGYGSINGYLANMFAIPLVGLVIMPYCLLCLALCSFSFTTSLMIPLSHLVTGLYYGLHLTEKAAFLNVNWHFYSIWQPVSVMAGILILILLPLRSLRPFAFIMLITPWLPQKIRLDNGELLLRVMDVGQGLAVVIHTAHHTLLFDTGDKFYQGSDLATLVLVPYFQTIRQNTLDAVIISHPDKDHRGGLQTLEAMMSIQQLIVNDPSYYHRGQSCHTMKPWVWDGITFRFFPIQEPFKNKNNTSCVLQIDNGRERILLTGDIEQEAEHYLVKQFGQQLQSNVLLLAHHASKTSSSFAFLANVNPQFALASIGFDNRFKFPHSKPLSILNYLKIPLFSTETCGMIEVHMAKNTRVKQPACYQNAT